MAVDRADFADKDKPRAGLTPPQAKRYLAAKAGESMRAVADEITRRAKAVLFNALKQDKTPGQVLFELDQELADYIPERDRAGKLVNVPHRIETIARTLTAESVNEARWTQFTDPDIAGFVTGVMFSAILDSRVRPNHAAWDGITRPIEDPIWFTPVDNRPPDGYNCRCLLIPVVASDEQDWTPDEQLPTEPAADEGFR